LVSVKGLVGRGTEERPSRPLDVDGLRASAITVLEWDG
jgi:hypothetical protein